MCKKDGEYLGALDHINREEFQNFRQDAGEHFKMLHECDRRIERKIEELAALLEPVLDEHAQSMESRRGRREVKMLAIGAALGAFFSAVTAAMLLLFQLG